MFFLYCYALNCLDRHILQCNEGLLIGTTLDYYHVSVSRKDDLGVSQLRSRIASYPNS